jgi:uncharacterized membrane protein YoaK (UPF0700 family)
VHTVESLMSLAIPIIAIVMGIGIAMLSVYLEYRKKRDIVELHHKERMAAIEKGMEIPALPAEFYRDSRGRCQPGDRLRRGLVMLFVGVAITIALNRTGEHYALWGLIPIAIGAANLLAYFIGGQRQPPDDRTRDNDTRSGSPR